MNYETKDSGARQSWPTGMQRDVSNNKPRFDLMVPNGVAFEDQLLTRLAWLMARGAEKYEARNWEQANTREEWERFRESAIRHFMEWFMNADDGEDHAAATLFNIMGAEYTLQRMAER